MKRVIAGSFLLSCLVAAGGCCMCAGPYDYCAPTFTECGDDCRPHARLGSAFSPSMPPEAFIEGIPVEESESVPPPSPRNSGGSQPAPLPMPLDDDDAQWPRPHRNR
jgi:hypothetical protein